MPSRADCLMLRLYDTDDAFLVAAVRLAGVLHRDAVGQLPAGVAVDPLDDAAADDDWLVRVADRRQGQRHARIAPQVAGLLRVRAGEEHDPVVQGANPERDRVR